MTKLSTLPFKKFFKNLKKHIFIYVFTALFSSVCTSHEFTTLRNCWTFGGGAENAGLENAGVAKMQGWKTRDWKTRHQTAGVENA